MNIIRAAEDVGLKEDNYVELLELFIKETTSDINKLQEAFKTLNTTEIAHITHGIKGASAVLGLIEFKKYAEAIEAHSRNNKLEEGMTIVLDLKRELDNLTAEIKDHRER